MSFILDALKKAEAERQRQTGPTLLEVRVTAPRRRLPLWTLIIAALLGVNILLLLIFVLRRPAATPVASAPAAAVTAPAPLPVPVPAALTAGAAATATPTTAPTTTPTTPPASTPATTPAATLPGATPSAITAPAMTGAEPAAGNPADYEPAITAGGVRNEPPSLAEIGGNLPDLRLDLHVYATRPADRYALINMHRVREGDVLPEGPRVVAIDRDGVELNYRGTEFMLRPQ
jgi:general secretion pathway protein B